MALKHLQHGKPKAHSASTYARCRLVKRYRLGRSRVLCTQGGGRDKVLDD
jgi:hypothetical protein